MKAILTLILIVASLLILTQKKALVQTRTSIESALKNPGLLMQTFGKNEVVQISEVQPVINIFEIESQYRGLPTERLKEELNKMSQKLETGAYIPRANLNQLNGQEREHLRQILNTLTVIQKLLVERQLEIAERSL